MSFTKLAGLGITAAKSNFMKLDKPYKLTFSVTYACQSRCKTCNIWQAKPKGELTLDEIRNFAAKNPFFKWIEITGGEPFLRSDIVEIVKAFVDNSKGLYILTMPTNSLCSKSMVLDKIEKILNLGIPKVSITISLDGYRELHDNIRGIPGNFDKAMSIANGLRELQSNYRNLFFVFGYTMSRYNQGEFDNTVQKVKEVLPWVTYNNFHVNAGQVSEIYYNNKDMLLKQDQKIMSEELRLLIEKRGFELSAIYLIESAFLRKLNYYVKTGESPMKGRSLDASLFMDSFGNVFPSIMWGRKLGNIKNTGYMLSGLWHNEEAEEVRRLIREGKEPNSWTACEAYQTIVGNIKSVFS